MENKSPLFAEFPAISTAEWMAKIEKDLKGKAMEALYWEPEPGLVVPPLYHSADPLVPTTTDDQREHNAWEIGQWIRVADLKEANTAVLRNLQGGVQAIQLHLTRSLSAAQLDQLLEGVIPAYVSLHFSWEDPGFPIQDFWPRLQTYLTKHEKNEALWKVSFSWQPASHVEALKPVVDLIRETENSDFQCLNVSAEQAAGEASTVENLAELISRGQAYIAQLQELGLEPSQTAQQLQFSLVIGNTFFLEIAKIRALKLLWANVLDAYQLAPIRPNICAYTTRPEGSDDPYHFMIQSATQAMSAVIGGASRLIVTPADQGVAPPDPRFTDKPDFGPRIARNVQHLLQMESFLDRVIDPGAGSYYIENLTQQLSTKAWALFQQRAI